MKNMITKKEYNNEEIPTLNFTRINQRLLDNKEKNKINEHQFHRIGEKKEMYPFVEECTIEKIQIHENFVNTKKQEEKYFLDEIKLYHDIHKVDEDDDKGKNTYITKLVRL